MAVVNERADVARYLTPVARLAAATAVYTMQAPNWGVRRTLARTPSGACPLGVALATMVPGTWVSNTPTSVEFARVVLDDRDRAIEGPPSDEARERLHREAREAARDFIERWDSLRSVPDQATMRTLMGVEW